MSHQYYSTMGMFTPHSLNLLVQDYAESCIVKTYFESAIETNRSSMRVLLIPTRRFLVISLQSCQHCFLIQMNAFREPNPIVSFYAHNFLLILLA
jgi:hypothetical protein